MTELFPGGSYACEDGVMHSPVCSAASLSSNTAQGAGHADLFRADQWPIL